MLQLQYSKREADFQFCVNHIAEWTKYQAYHLQKVAIVCNYYTCCKTLVITIIIFSHLSIEDETSQLWWKLNVLD